MKLMKIEVLTDIYKWTNLKKVLSKIGASGVTVFQALGCGVEKGTYEYEIETNKEMELLPKQMIVIVVEEEKVEPVIEAIKKELYTGHIGDGKIFVSELSNVIRVRTGDEGPDALK